MSNRHVDDTELDRRIAATLGRRPKVEIDPAFAARVAAQATRLSMPRFSAPLASRRAGMMAVAMLLAALAALAPRSLSQSVLGTSVEWTLCAELLGVAVWLGLTTRTS